MLDPAIGMESKTAVAARVDRVGPIPRPPSELGALIVRDRLVQLFWRIHDKWTHLKYGSTDRLALEK